MIYLVTGASGFIGKRLVRKLLSRRGATVYFLMRDASPERCDALRAFWDADETRAVPVVGDLNKDGLGLSEADRTILKDRVDHVFHLAFPPHELDRRGRPLPGGLPRGHVR